MAAIGTVSYTYYDIYPVKKVDMSWSCSTAGSVDGITQTKRLQGEILRIVFIPSTATLTKPKDDYDVIIYDDNGLDVLAGQGTNCSSATPTHICPGVGLKDGTTTSVVPIFINDTLDLYVTGAGTASGKTGQVIFYYR